MWGSGARFYWGKKEERSCCKVEGLVVVFSWLSSEEKHLKRYIDLYGSLGWDSLICHSQFVKSFFPEKVTSLALEVLDEIVEDLKRNPRPVVFASFSGGPKACTYKVLQIIDGKREVPNLDKYRLVRDCVAGHIFDSCPVDFTSDVGARFVTHPTVLKMSNPPWLVKWTANSIASGLDALFLSRFESQRAEFWQSLYSSVAIGAPYLILCSEDDDLASCQIIRNFAHRLRELGGDVNLVKWNSSPHVGHYKEHPAQYAAAVIELLQKASTVYSRRVRQSYGEKVGLVGAHNEFSEPFSKLRRAGGEYKEGLNSLPDELTDHLVVPSSFEYQEGRRVGSASDEGKETPVQLPSYPPRINAHGVLGQVLFDVCVPKTVEDWDIRSSRRPHASTWGQTHLNPIKCIRRSRL